MEASLGPPSNEWLVNTGPLACTCHTVRLPIRTYTMTKESLIPTIIGSRSGYAIRFSCPSCHNENTILYNMPKPYYKETREANCKRCRTRYTIYVPDENSKKVLNSI